MQFDKNGSPFLPLPHPHTSFIITPLRATDADAVIAAFNDRAVYMYLVSPPLPFTRQDWERRFETLSKSTDDALAELREVQAARKQGSNGDKRWVSASPFTAIREVDEKTGEQRFIGEINIKRQAFRFVSDNEERNAMKNKNDSLETGDPNIVWEMGFFLSPSAHGRGIMTAALGVLINSFFIPFMNVHHIMSGFLDPNPGSKRVFEKNGFIFEKIYPDAIELSEKKTGVKGKRVGLGIMTWDRSFHSKSDP